MSSAKRTTHGNLKKFDTRKTDTYNLLNENLRGRGPLFFTARPYHGDVQPRRLLVQVELRSGILRKCLTKVQIVPE